MKKFEQGQSYYYGGLTYKIIKRTEQTATIQVIQHFGRFNERITKQVNAKIRDWDTREVVIIKDVTIEAE